MSHPMIIDLLIRVTVLLGAGSFAASLLHRRSASLRHLVWAASLGGSLLLAVLAPWSPRIDVPMWRGKVIGAVTLPERGDAAITFTTNLAADPVVTGNIPESSLSTPSLGLLVWAFGAFAILAWTMFGRFGLAMLARRARPVTDRSWRQMVDTMCRQMSVRRSIAICETASVGAPMTWGASRPVLVLPTDSQGWGDALRKSVVAHEVAHVARNDYLVQLMATITCAVFWFHPLAWHSARRLRQAAERACDDEVLALGATGEEYAAHLIGVARSSHQLRLRGAVAIGMARPSTLEGRIVAVLDSSRSRGRASRTVRMTVAASAFAVLSLVGTVQPVAAKANTSFTIPLADSGSILAAPISVPTRNKLVRELPPSPTNPLVSVPPPVTTQGPDSVVDRSFNSVPGGRLTLTLRSGGGVTVRGWDDNRVRVRALLGGPDWRDVTLSIDREDNGVRVDADFDRRRGNHSTSNHFEIMVPRRYDVRLSSAGGSLTLIGLDGSFTGHTGGGELTLDGVTGSARLTTGGGEIDVRDSDLSGTVSTGGGTVRLSNVRGGLRGSSGSGPVIYGRSEQSGRATTDISSVEVSGGGSRVRVGRDGDDRSGKLFIDKAGGNIDLDAAPNGAVVRTGGGYVRIGRGAPSVEATTGGGDVTVGPIAGSVYARTGAGEVRVIVDKVSWTQNIEASSGKGRIIIELPRDFDGVLDLETAYTESHEATSRITSDWQIERDPLTDWDSREGTARRYLRARAALGNGSGRVRVKTVNGEIEIRRR